MIIRKATVTDSEQIASCLFLAMEDFVYSMIGGKDPKQGKEFLLYFVQTENNQYSYQNCWVAEEDKKVVAAANLYDGAQLHSLRQPVLEHLKRKYRKDFTPEDETQAGEYYLDSLGVARGQQGRGIGSYMLQFLVDEWVVKQGKTLGLLVDEENQDAKRLYLKLGFKSAGQKVFLGKKTEHLQKR